MTHDEEVAFFQQMRECRDAYRRLADAIHSTLGDHTVIDMGCGVGDVAERLEELGWNVIGAEYSEVARSMTNCRTRFLDLRSEPYLERYEVVICTETAEHLGEEWADSIVENVATVATKWIVWSAAQPGQEWPGHVNLQPAQYWLDKLYAVGWVWHHSNTLHLRERTISTQAQHMYCAGNFFVLERR